MYSRSKRLAFESKDLELECVKEYDTRASRCGRRTNSPDFVFATYLKENHGQAIYAVEFCHHLKAGEPIIFATCGSNRATIYECQNNSEIKLLQCYSDPIGNEMYYSCSWSFDPITSTPILAVGGNNKIIRIINTTKMTSDKHFVGHGEAINELKFHPKNPIILLSASKDHSIRLWNIQTDVCIAIFGGVEGHKSSVLSVDFDAIGSRIASSGKDKSVKVWHLNKPSIEEAIQASFTFDRNESKHSFRTVMKHFADHSVDDIHENCVVDCVKWMGNLIFSKSCENCVVCWKPGILGKNIIASNSCSSVICKFVYVGGQYPFFRFSMDIYKTYMALGNGHGTTFVWHITEDEPSKGMQLNHCLCTAKVRATAFSRDAKILISVCDDGTVWKWDKV